MIKDLEIGKLFWIIQVLNGQGLYKGKERGSRVNKRDVTTEADVRVMGLLALQMKEEGPESRNVSGSRSWKRQGNEFSS